MNMAVKADDRPCVNRLRSVLLSVQAVCPVFFSTCIPNTSSVCMCLCVWGDHRMETLCHRVPGVAVEQLQRMERSEYSLVLRGLWVRGA